MGNRAFAKQLYDAGVVAINDKAHPENVPQSYINFVSAVYADPTFGEGWYQVANNNGDLNQLPAAVACYRRALECENTDENKAKIYCNLGWRLHALGQTDDALAASEIAVKLDPKLAYGWINLSIIYQALSNTEKSLACAKTAYEMAPLDPVVEMALSFALLFDRQLAEGFKHMEVRWKYKLHNFLHYPYPAWKGEPGKTVFLVNDQGLGDTLSFSRFVEAAAARCKFLHICMQPQLMRAFSHAFRHIKNINLIPGAANMPQADYWTTFISLPFALGLNDEQIRNAKNIALPVYSLPKTWKVPDRKFHIGIAWAGSPLNNIDAHRNIPIEQFLSLYQVPGIQLYSLQIGDRAKEMHDQGCAAVIKDLSGYVSDVVDTVSLMQDLDLVICCESALGHIAAAANKECWIPYSYLGRDYRIGLKGDDMLWTPKHKIFRQCQDRQWKRVFDRISISLAERVT